MGSATPGADASDVERVQQAAVGRLFRNLTRWFGVEGTRALFIRALAISKADHPGLAHIEVRDSEPYFKGITTKALANGNATTSQSLEALVLTVIDLLDRQLGSNLTMRLMDPDEITETGDATCSDGTGGNDA